MTNVKNAAIVATLLRETPKPVILLGAGASVTSGIPLAGEVVNIAAKWAFARQNGRSTDDPRITRSDWYPWLLTTQSWFREDVSLASLFPYAVEHLLQPQKIRKEFWIRILNPNVPISIGYLRLVELMHLQKVTNVLTTNFDECLVRARNFINRPHHIDVIKSSADYTKISSTPLYPSLIYLHGAVENYTDKNVVDEVKNMDPAFVQNLLPLLKDYPLIVVGYRGSEASIMEHLLINNADKTFNYKNGIYWCIRKGESPSEATEYVKSLAQLIGSNFQFVEIESFDHLFDKVIWQTLDEQKMKISTVQHIIKDVKTEIDFKNFDLKNAKAYEDTDFDFPLLRVRLLNYCNRLNIAVPNRVDDVWLQNQMLYLSLMRRANAETYTTNAGLLLFSNNPQRFIPEAKVVIRFIGDELWLKKVLGDNELSGRVYEKVITGNLWTQLNEITSALALVNKPFRLKSEKSEYVLPYDSIALKEITVNSFVHRDYEIPMPNTIEIYPDKIVVRNPGGLTEEVKAYFEDEVMYQEIKKGRRGIKGYRNPVLADLFYSSGDMDKMGSGLYDVVTRVASNSGFVEFSPNIDNTDFTVEIWCRPEAIDEITNTASPISVISTKFSTNIIEIKALPDSVYYAPALYLNKKEIYETYQNIYFPPFHFYENNVYTLSDINKSLNTLRNVVDTNAIERLAIDEFIAQEEGEKRFVRFLNDYLKSYFQQLGLIVDPKRKRAYFPKTDEGERTVSYQARFKKATRTVVKPRHNNVAKDRIRYWEHKAFSYTVKKFGVGWGIMIEPSYVFTIDGLYHLFASKKVGALATKRAARDYNLNVLNDIIFWLWVIAGGVKDVFSLNSLRKVNFDDDIVLSNEYLSTSFNYVQNADDLQDNELEQLDDVELMEEIALAAEEEETETGEDSDVNDIDALDDDLNSLIVKS